MTLDCKLNETVKGHFCSVLLSSVIQSTSLSAVSAVIGLMLDTSGTINHSLDLHNKLLLTSCPVYMNGRILFGWPLRFCRGSSIQIILDLGFRIEFFS